MKIITRQRATVQILQGKKVQLYTNKQWNNSKIDCKFQTTGYAKLDKYQWPVMNGKKIIRQMQRQLPDTNCPRRAPADVTDSGSLVYSIWKFIHYICFQPFTQSLTLDGKRTCSCVRKVETADVWFWRASAMFKQYLAVCLQIPSQISLLTRSIKQKCISHRWLSKLRSTTSMFLILTRQSPLPRGHVKTVHSVMCFFSTCWWIPEVSNYSWHYSVKLA